MIVTAVVVIEVAAVAALVVAVVDGDVELFHCYASYSMRLRTVAHIPLVHLLLPKMKHQKTKRISLSKPQEWAKWK